MGPHVLVLHVFEKSQFSVRSSAVDEGLERSRELLNGHLLTEAHVIRRAKEREIITIIITVHYTILHYILYYTMCIQ